MQQANEAQRELSVCVVEKGSEVGAHILSGAVLEPRALRELFPDWESRGAPLTPPVVSARRPATAQASAPKPARKLPAQALPRRARARRS